ncbi:MAG: hypothetical protein QN716_08995, partial [Nitrososphaeraceae archaeon]|nr:hypothetical protein [Nitrososphaeraceae archaeon]
AIGKLFIARYLQKMIFWSVLSKENKRENIIPPVVNITINYFSIIFINICSCSSVKLLCHI